MTWQSHDNNQHNRNINREYAFHLDNGLLTIFMHIFEFKQNTNICTCGKQQIYVQSQHNKKEFVKNNNKNIKRILIETRNIFPITVNTLKHNL